MSPRQVLHIAKTFARGIRSRKSAYKKVGAYDTVGETVGDVDRVRQKVARDYKLVYNLEDGGGAELSHVDIETQRHARRLKRKHNDHRAIDERYLTAGASFDDITE